jgi:hypothetical protein
VTDLFAPYVHGALGPWDEILTLAPLVVGVLLLLYLYFTSRPPRPSPDDDTSTASSQEPPAH